MIAIRDNVKRYETFFDLIENAPDDGYEFLFCADRKIRVFPFVHPAFRGEVRNGVREKQNKFQKALKKYLNKMTTAANLQDVNFLPVPIASAVKIVVNNIKKKDGSYFCLANIHVIMESHRDVALKKALNNAAGVFADGMGTAGALKYLGYMFKDRVRGKDLMMKLCEYSLRKGLKIYLYGNTEDTLRKLKNILESLYPGLKIAGYYSPPFRDLTGVEDDEIVRTINNTDPDILFVSLGAPKQEKWMAQHKGRIKAIQIGVGAAFDMIAGNLSEAPDWMKRHYLEWLYRLPQQPKKTIYRMSLLPEFLLRLFAQKFWR